ncbi:hypothetical protein DUI87_03787 [Hirundo rustica rustica]|uniref:ribonuclease H n=1 Tax=Hirundo rustica rustica TaxID=333673 RepID=A0A3M0L0W6_HIRRU|nr:hypothetical protein DUI87_03787 [Hirundo rustica rustica]
MAEELAPVLAGEGAQPVGTEPLIVVLTEGQMEEAIISIFRRLLFPFKDSRQRQFLVPLSDLDAAVVIPVDLEQLFSCLLDSTEFKLWVAAWRQQLREALPSLLRDPETVVDDNGNPLTLEHLMGEGRWADPSDQTSDIPIKALQIAREHAVSAFFGMAPDGPVVPYYKTVQGTKESFTKFVKRLTRAIEVQVTDVAVRDGILREMVFANANNMCRSAILSLPLDPPPTLPDMLRVCQLKVPYLQGNDREGKSVTPRVSAVSGTQGPTRGPHEPYWLQLTEALHLRTADWTFLSINTKEQGAWPVQGKELVIIGDCKYTPQEVEILPGVLVNDPRNLILWLRCTHPPTFIPKGQVIAQIIPTRGPNNTPVACPVQAITEERPRVDYIKDCFFQIPLHPDDAPRFAFSVPTINREAPRRRYHWRVLLQGMKNSPVICQWYVASLLSPVRAAAGQAIIYHYMDDVLVCAPNDDMLSHVLGLTVDALVAAGFELQEEKVQRMPPWKYLGLEIGKRTIVPQKLAIKTKVSSLADVHQLCGALNWVRPWLGLTTNDLAPLFNLLKGGEELSSPRVLIPEAEKALEKVQDAMSKRQAHRFNPELPFKFIIMGKLPHLHGMIFQWRNIPKKDREGNDPLSIIEWVFLSHQRSKRMIRPQELVAELIRKARFRIRELAGCDFECIHIPIGLRSGQISKAMLEHLLQENEALQFALDSFTGQISIHRPAHKIFNSEVKFVLSLKEVRSRRPLKALTIFTDASGRSHKSVLTWKDPQTQQWEADIAEVEGSPQVAELAAVVRAFERFPEPFNLVTDSAYVAGVVSRADQAILQEVSNIALYDLFSKLVRLISHREQPYFVMHTRSHTDLPGFIAEGNRKADALAAPAEMAPLPNIFMQAKLSHQLFHQNAPGLVRRFHLMREQARAIVATCPSCSQQAVPTLHAGVNPRGLRSCQAMVERTHGTIKRMLHQQQRVLRTESPSVRLARALFTINFLNCSYEGLNPPIVWHFGASSLFGVKKRPQVMVRDPGSGGTEGPHDLVTWGRGYACVSTPTGPKWIPAKWVRPYVPKSPGSGKISSPQVTMAEWRRKRKTSNEES